MTEPRFCIVLCSHDGASYIDAQLQSLAQQSYAPASIDAHDWASSDTTLSRLRSWEKEARLPLRVTAHDSAPGPCRSFFHALEASLSRYPEASHFLFCDQDDVWSAEKLERYRHVIRSATSSPDLIFSDLTLIGVDGSEISPSFYHRSASPFSHEVTLQSPDLALVNPAVGMSVCISRELAQRMVTHASMPWSMHDWSAVLLCRIYDMPSHFLATATAGYRQHPRNLRGAPSFSDLRLRLQRLRSRYGTLRALLAHVDEYPAAVRGRARALLPASRFAAVRMILGSRNLRLWYRVSLAAMTLVLW